MALSLKILAITFGTIGSVATILPLFYHPHWAIRMFDFPRLQICVFLIIGILLFALPQTFNNWFTITSILVLSVCLGYQIKHIFPYTRIAPKQVKGITKKDEAKQVSFLIANVLTTNREYYHLINLVKQYDPDILLTLETDKDWERALEEIEGQFNQSIKIPLDNLYGMHFYSKLEITNQETRYLIADSIPSIHGKFKLKSGHEVFFHCLHPTPPFPGENESSVDRDGELLLVGKEIEKREESTVVFGDLNDVAWSKTTKLFKKISGLLDPRKGRGMYSTFNAKYPFFRWPLDHLFHSKDFHVVKVKRLADINSDHFPIFVELQYQPHESHDPLNSEADYKDRETASDRIDEATKGKPRPELNVKE
jgi:endonuclease/exonuclease/phosphatase (EEP) superfamily protein YafD